MHPAAAPSGRWRAALAVLAATGLATATTPGHAQSGQEGRTAEAGLDLVHVRGPVYLLAGAGGNITLSVGPDGVLLVDSGVAEMSGPVLAAIRQVQAALAARETPVGFGSETRSELFALRAPPAPPKPIRYILNTHFHPDHTGGNDAVAAAGRTITGGNVAGDLSDASQSAAVVAHESVLHRMSRIVPALPFRALPTDAYFTPFFKLGAHFNGEGIQLIDMPAAHTEHDSLIWFRGSDVISTGDVFIQTGYPRIDLEAGGSVNGIVDALNHILDLAFPEFRLEGGTMIVPGHGRLSDSSDVAYYRDMVTVIRDRVQDMIDKGRTLDQVKAARPTLDYDPRFGATTGPWTTDMFVTAVYRSLSVSGEPRRLP